VPTDGRSRAGEDDPQALAHTTSTGRSPAPLTADRAPDGSVLVVEPADRPSIEAGAARGGFTCAWGIKIYDDGEVPLDNQTLQRATSRTPSIRSTCRTSTTSATV
jgi:hypothetical protein